MKYCHSQWKRGYNFNTFMRDDYDNSVIGLTIAVAIKI